MPTLVMFSNTLKYDELDRIIVPIPAPYLNLPIFKTISVKFAKSMIIL
jgi:hypothetical protein